MGLRADFRRGPAPSRGRDTAPMVGFGDPPNHAALVRTVLAGDPVGLRTGREDREAVGARRGLVQEVGSDVLGLPRHRPADPLGRGGRVPDPMAGRFSDLAVASTNHRKTEASSAASGGAYVLRRLTPSQTAKVQLREAVVPKGLNYDTRSTLSHKRVGSGTHRPRLSRWEVGDLAGEHSEDELVEQLDLCVARDY